MRPFLLAVPWRDLIPPSDLSMPKLLAKACVLFDRDSSALVKFWLLLPINEDDP